MSCMERDVGNFDKRAEALGYWISVAEWRGRTDLTQKQAETVAFAAQVQKEVIDGWSDKPFKIRMNEPNENCQTNKERAELDSSKYKNNTTVKPLEAATLNTGVVSGFYCTKKGSWCSNCRRKPGT